MQRLYEETESEFTRKRIRAFMTRVPCQVCQGARLKPEILAVTIRTGETELNIHQFSELTIEAAAQFIARLDLTEQQRKIVADVLREIESRLQFLVEVGLDYLTLEPRKRHTFRRRSAAHPAGDADRLGSGRRSLRAR